MHFHIGPKKILQLRMQRLDRELISVDNRLKLRPKWTHLGYLRLALTTQWRCLAIY